MTYYFYVRYIRCIYYSLTSSQSHCIVLYQYAEHNHINTSRLGKPQLVFVGSILKQLPIRDLWNKSQDKSKPEMSRK